MFENITERSSIFYGEKLIGTQSADEYEPYVTRQRRSTEEKGACLKEKVICTVN